MKTVITIETEFDSQIIAHLEGLKEKIKSAINNRNQTPDEIDSIEINTRNCKVNIDYR